MHHGQPIPELVNDEPKPKDLERLNVSLRLPRSTILIAQSGGAMGKIDFADARRAPLDTSSCAPKLEPGPCEGIACGKGVSRGNNQNEDRCRFDGAVLSDCTLRASRLTKQYPNSSVSTRLHR
jgi:hypothetical protein